MFGSATLIGYGIYDGNEKVYSNLLIPIIHKTMDGERAHNFAIFLAKYGLVPRERKFENEQILVNCYFINLER